MNALNDRSCFTDYAGLMRNHVITAFAKPR